MSANDGTCVSAPHNERYRGPVCSAAPKDRRRTFPYFQSDGAEHARVEGHGPSLAFCFKSSGMSVRRWVASVFGKKSIRSQLRRWSRSDPVTVLAGPQGVAANRNDALQAGCSVVRTSAAWTAEALSRVRRLDGAAGQDESVTGQMHDVAGDGCPDMGALVGS